MPRYELYGRAFESDMPLPELAEAGTPAEPGLSFERRMPPPIESGRWFVIWRRPDGDPWVQVSRTAGGHRIQYCKCAEFHFETDARRLSGETIDCSEGMFRHFLIDQVVPLVMSLDAPVLHASSVAIDGNRLAAFSGPGGSGKSTLATALARRGHAIGADDALMVVAAGARVRAVPAYPGIRLWNDSERAVAADLAGTGRTEPVNKQRFSSGLRFLRGESILTHLYVLDPAPAPAIAFTRLSPRDTAIELVRETYRLALDDRGALAREFDALTDVAARLACWRLSFPRDLDRSAALAADVEAHVRASGDRASDIGHRISDIGPTVAV